MICNQLQLLSNSKNSFTEVESMCMYARVCVCEPVGMVHTVPIAYEFGVCDCSHVSPVVFGLCASISRCPH